jgi:dolichol-phosphate mannosyltransferase
MPSRKTGSFMKIVVIIPTYNEAENISKLVPALSEEFKKMPHHEFLVLVVDGNSPDGTAGVVTNLAQSYAFVRLLLEKKKAGLGAAYVYGFEHAIKELGAEVLVEMDADFQHDPCDVVRLIAEIDNGYDYVIGSRFIEGGSIPSNWAFHRRLLSWGGNIICKVVLGLFKVNDFTSGFKASRVQDFVDKVDLNAVLSDGFAYKIDLLFRMHKVGAKFKEIPIQFGMRDRGDSKMERGNALDSLRVVIQLRMHESRRFIKFVIAGFAGLFTDTGIFNVLRLVLLPSYYASALSGVFAMMVTYTINNTWSFKDRKKTSFKQNIGSFAFYSISSYIPIIIRSWLVAVFVRSFGDTFLVANTAFFIGLLFGLVWNFTVYSRIIWRKKEA